MAKGIEHSREGLMSQGIRILILLGVLAAFLGMPVFGADTPVVIKLWNANISQKKFYQQIFKDFNKANPDIKVEYTAQTSAEAMTKALDDAYRAADPPDLFIAINAFNWPNTEMIPGGMAKAVELGWLTPLDLLAPNKQELSTWLAKFPQDKQPFLESKNVFGGKAYSWPSSEPNGFWVLFNNTKIFRDAGLKGSDDKITAPETWDDLRFFAKKITQLGQGKVYGMIDKSTAWDLAASEGWLTYGFTGDGGFNIRTGKFDFSSPILKAAIQMWIDVKKDGSFYPGIEKVEDWHDVDEKFTLGLVGMLPGNIWEASLLNESTLDVDIAVFPPQKKEQTKFYGLTSPLAAYSEYVVSNKVKNKEAAIWKVIQFMTSQAYQEGWIKAVGGGSFYGSGFSVFPQFNKPELFPHPVYAKIVDICRQQKINPQWPGSVGKLWEFFTPGNPNLWEVMNGIYNEQMGWEALDELNVRYDATLDKALAEVNKGGVDLTRVDLTFPDWDPTKDYVTKKKW